MDRNTIRFIICSETINLRDTAFSLKRIWKLLVDNGNLNNEIIVTGDENSIPEVTNQTSVKPIFNVFRDFLFSTRNFLKIKNGSN